MTTVLLVEDIDLVRNDIRNLIDWEDNGYAIVGEANNGETGLSLCRALKPDIVVVDVKMPLMSGLEMIRRIRNERTNVQFVLLTAYEEFDFAKQAIQLGVQSYVVKHELEGNILLQELSKLRHLLLQNRVSSSAARAQEVSELVRGRKELANTNTIDDLLSCIPLLIKPLRSDNHLPSIAALDDKVAGVELFEPEQGMLLAFVHPLDTRSKARKAARIKTLCSSISAECGFPLAVAVGSPIADIDGIGAVYAELKVQLDDRIFASDACAIHWCKQRSSDNREGTTTCTGLLSGFSRLLVQQNYSTARQILKALICEELPNIGDTNLYSDCVRRVAMMICSMPEFVETGDARIQLNDLMSGEVPGPLSSVFQALDDAIAALENRSMLNYSRKVKNMLKYIAENYSDDITMEILAERECLSPIYAGQLFKREVGITFSKYLTNIRIETAVELLRTGQYKVYEVSEMVGYRTIPYFSKVFKRHIGKSPSEFQ